MATAADLGISEQEFQDAINLEKMYSYVAACHDQCTRCGSSPIAYYKTETTDLLCDDCGRGKPQCKRLGDSHIKKHEVDKFEKKFGKMNSSRRKESSPVAMKPSSRDSKKKHRNKKSSKPPPPSSSSSSESADESTASSGSSDHKRRDKAKRSSSKSSKKKKSTRRKSSSSIENATDLLAKSGWGTFESAPARNLEPNFTTSPVAGMMGLLQQQQQQQQQQHQQQQQQQHPQHFSSQMQRQAPQLNGQYPMSSSAMIPGRPPQSLVLPPSSWQSQRIPPQPLPQMNYQVPSWRNDGSGFVANFQPQWRTNNPMQPQSARPLLTSNNPFSANSVFRQPFQSQSAHNSFAPQSQSVPRSATTNPFLRPLGSNTHALNRNNSQYSSPWPSSSLSMVRNPFNTAIPLDSQLSLTSMPLNHQSPTFSGPVFPQSSFMGHNQWYQPQMPVRR